jgi:hypothetical protein
LSLCKHNPLALNSIQRILDFKRPGLILKGYYNDKEGMEEQLDELKKRFYLKDLRVLTTYEISKLPMLSRFFSIVEEGSSEDGESAS